jgi:hypothetical protein
MAHACFCGNVILLHNSTAWVFLCARVLLIPTSQTSDQSSPAVAPRCAVVALPFHLHAYCRWFVRDLFPYCFRCFASVGCVETAVPMPGAGRTAHAYSAVHSARMPARSFLYYASLRACCHCTIGVDALEVHCPGECARESSDDKSRTAPSSSGT